MSLYALAQRVHNLVREDEKDVFSRAARLFGAPNQQRPLFAVRVVDAAGAEAYRIVEDASPEKIGAAAATVLAASFVTVRAGCWVCERWRVAAISAGAALVAVPHTGARIVGALLLCSAAAVSALDKYRRYVDAKGAQA